MPFGGSRTRVNAQKECRGILGGLKGGPAISLKSFHSLPFPHFRNYLFHIFSLKHEIVLYIVCFTPKKESSWAEKSPHAM